MFKIFYSQLLGVFLGYKKSKFFWEVYNLSRVNFGPSLYKVQFKQPFKKKFLSLILDRSRDAPLNPHFTNNQHHHHQHNNTNNHHQNTNNSHSINQNHHQHHHHHQQQQQQQLLPPGTIGSTCDDLDCFFCEQIATHIEHKRSAANSNINFEMGESPTRKRGRFY